MSDPKGKCDEYQVYLGNRRTALSDPRRIIDSVRGKTGLKPLAQGTPLAPDNSKPSTRIGLEGAKIYMRVLADGSIRRRVSAAIGACF